MTTTKPVAPLVAPSTPRFPEFPPRDDMQNFKLLYEHGNVSSVRRHLGPSPDIIVYSELPLGWNHRRQSEMRVPDILIAFNVNRHFIVADGGYSIEDHGKSPEFVLEIASPTTSRNDETDKRDAYAAFRVGEYWRFDDTGGRLYRAALAGDRLVNGRYEPIEVREVSWARIWGYSAALNLYVCWEYGHLRWYDPVEQRYLLTHDEEAEAHMAEREAHMAEREAHMAEREARIAEREARITAEAMLADAEERIRRLEEEIQQRRDS